MAILAGCWLGMVTVAAAQLPTPGDRGSPGSTTGGATRGSGCTADGPIAVGLSPEGLKTPPESEGAVTLVTTLANPTLYAQVPETTAEIAELLVISGSGVVVDTQTTPLRGGNTTLSMTMLSAGKTLAVGETYRWALSLVCDPGDRSSDRIILGTIALQAQDTASPSPTPSNLPSPTPANSQLRNPGR
jgi:hypothetical protein